MPDNVATPPADAPVTLTQDQITEEAVTKGLEAAAAIEAPPAPADPVEGEEVEGEPAPEEAPPAEAPPAEAPPAETPPAEAPPAEKPVEEMTDEERDEHDAKELGFKNQRANKEFKAQRAELRELRPLKDELADVKPLAERWNKVYTYCQTHNVDADAFAQGMAMIAGTRSADVAVMTKTLEGLEWEADRLRQKLGIGGGSYDPLKEPANADLARAVENEEMTPQWAQQQARARAELTHRTTLEKNQQQTQQEQQALNTERTQAITDLDAIEAEYKGIDPQYEAKSALLVPMLQPIFARLAPKDWPAAFRQAYQEFRLPAGPTAAHVPPSTPPAPLRSQPLRPGAHPANQVKEVKTELDALEEGLRAAAALDGVPYRASA
jgi:hypothetical protein